MTYSPLFSEVQSQVEFRNRPHYRLLLQQDAKDPEGRWYFQIEVQRPDTYTGEMGVGRGGKAYLSPHMNVSELTRVAFGLFKAYDEHECREAFTWKGRAIFGPHVDSQALWEVAERLDFRS